MSNVQDVLRTCGLERACKQWQRKLTLVDTLSRRRNIKANTVSLMKSGHWTDHRKILGQSVPESILPHGIDFMYDIMKLPLLLSLVLLPFPSFAARKPTVGTFEKYHARSQSNAPLKLDDASYQELTATPRNHSVLVLLTALDARFGCQLCRDFQPEWDLLGKSWAKGDRDGLSQTLLGTLDFLDGKATFQKVRLHGSHHSLTT